MACEEAASRGGRELTTKVTENTKGWILDTEQWAQAFEGWLAGKGSEHTRQVYRHAWQLLVNATGKLPWDLQQQDLQNWLDAMQRRGNSPSSLQVRLAAVRSYYRMLEPLGVSNPAAGLRVPGLTGRRLLSPDQVEAFLAAIPTHTLNGSRDYALFLCYLSSGRRNSQVRLLRHAQLESKGERLWLTWQASGRFRRELCPERLKHAIDRYRILSGVADPSPQDYLFTAWPGGKPSPAPLSTSTVCRLVKMYAARAGLGADLTVQVLRDTGKEGRRREYHR
jgi:integrase